MDEGCTCHLGAPPCGYCVEGTANYQEALGFAEMLDDRELARLMDDIDRMREERAEKRAAKERVLAVVLKAQQPTPQPRHPVALGLKPNPDLTPPERVAQIGLMMRTITMREKVRKSMAKAMAIPTDPKPWDAFDATDRAYYEPTSLGPKGDGAQWDNRRRRVR